jgi:hypothetical protein
MRKCNYRAEMTVLNVGRLAGVMSRNTSQVCVQARTETPRRFCDSL